MVALRQAKPEHKLEVYLSLGLRLTYLPDTQTVRAEVDLAAHRWDSVCCQRTLRFPRGWTCAVRVCGHGFSG